jgi:Fic family protein
MPVNPEKAYRITTLKSPKGPKSAEEWNALFQSGDVWSAVKKAQERYLAWDEFRQKSWVPGNKEHVWALLQIQRRSSNRKTPIKDKDGHNYHFDPNTHSQFLHEVDLELGGNLIGLSDFGEGDKRQIIRRNLIEESIASSKLEGANTSREAARRLLHEGRLPKDKDEQMIFNNHSAMVQIEQVAKSQPMSIELLRNLHRKVTEKTLADRNFEGAFRETLDSKGNRLKVIPWNETIVAYVTPDRDFVEVELPKLVAFANDEHSDEFIHPLFKAIMLHFWIGLLHPFEDGNGRLARILFYWYMLRKGYWAFSYLSLSERIIKSPSQYAMAYVNAEQDNYDLNYFINYNIEKLKLAREQLQVYLKTKIAENRRAMSLVQQGYGFNPRQLRLLQYLSKDEQRATNPSSYQNLNSEINYVTVISDLKKLVEGGFLEKKKNGRNVFYFPTVKVRALFK